MNDDRLGEWELGAATSSRDFGCLQVLKWLTRLGGPAIAAAAGMFGKFVDIRDVTLN